ncbi:hypothetical protein [Ferrovum sp.]|uniref:hypothetical protein n=1 Tax=Ferrovum sp. TaxID=2609467 RepID=UPI002626D1E9|nr:hypothetical protein [Ferrovum sp.]
MSRWNPSQTRLFLVLAIVFMVTRNHQWTPVLHLPDASLAVFFLAGMLLTSRWTFPALCLLGAGVDAWAITQGGVSSYCVTPAYALLLPASATLWLSGRLSARLSLKHPGDGFALSLGVSLSTLGAELFSSGGFYFLSGRFPHPTLSGFLPRLLQYSPAVIGATLCYVAMAMILKQLVYSQRSTVPNLRNLELPRHP